MRLKYGKYLFWSGVLAFNVNSPTIFVLRPFRARFRCGGSKATFPVLPTRCPIVNRYGLVQGFTKPLSEDDYTMVK